LIVPQSVEVEATVTSNISSVVFSDGSTKIGTGTPNNAFIVNWKLSTPGTYTVSAVGTDGNGNHYYPPSVTFTTVEDVPPSVTITTPTSGTTYVGPTDVPLEASATSSDGTIETVTFYNGSTRLGDGPNYDWKKIPAGTYSITAVATDEYGVSTTSAPVTLIITADVPPSVTITSPTSGTTYTGPTSVDLDATATSSDAVVETVAFYNGSTKLGNGPLYSWNNIPAGTYTITAVATDNYGVSTTSAPVTLIITADVPPTVAITSPANGSTFASGSTVTLEASASSSDGAVETLAFYNGSTKLKTVGTEPYQYNWPKVAAGTYSITAVATDNYGVSTTSAPVTITVNP
jgi:Bacterial Ig domain